MAADDGEEFVTIVPVGEARPPRDPTFVTVLTVGAAAGACEVSVRRPRGCRLGLGLKFEGGSAAAEKVRRLLVQSCAEDSPAASACAPWGKLIPGDEILAIDGIPVSELTRIDCVRRLKDSDEMLKLLVRHFEEDEEVKKTVDVTDSSMLMKLTADISRPTCLPPPVPPRKLNKKNSFKDRATLQAVGEQICSINEICKLKALEKDGVTINSLQGNLNSKLSRKSSFDSHIHRQAKENLAVLKRSSPEEVRRLVRRLSDGKAMPPEADVYIDLLSQEWERCLALADAESDDTGSSISTVVDRVGSMTSSVESSIPSTPTMQPKTIDIQRVLNCIENIDSDLLKDIDGNSLLEKPIEIPNDTKCTENATFTNGITSNDITKTTSITGEVQRKKLLLSDKNNNNTVLRNITCINIDSNDLRQTSDRTRSKVETTAKPKPMPRSSRPERLVVEDKSRSKPVSDTITNSDSELLLTPTKKNCIENWLQRSEAELGNKKRLEGFEDISVPEALPRLIDFVPKQFKDAECSNVEPTSPPPPVPTSSEPHFEQAPTESREDGSGASLDTIGELDEGGETLEPQKPAVRDHVTAEKRTAYERTYWEDRANKSDAEDSKSLSNDETPPTCPRQPPDGVETPSDIVEKPPPPSTDIPTRLPPRLSATWSTGRTRFTYSRAQDARSECSVKDKIAMFSNSRAASTEHLDKCGYSPSRHCSTLTRKSTYTSNYSQVGSLDRRLTKSHENLDDVPQTPRSYKHVEKRPEVLGGIECTRPTIDTTDAKVKRYPTIVSKPLHHGSSSLLSSTKPAMKRSESVYHTRSVSDDGGTGAHRSTLEYLIEQRKKSMSKLRGLMIPEVQGPIVDLPEIKIRETANVPHLYNTNKSNAEKSTYKFYSKKPLNINDTWKNNLLPNNIPKYSPAFKRKSLQVYTNSSISKDTTPERSFGTLKDINRTNLENHLSKSIPLKPPRASLDPKKYMEHSSSSTLPPRISLSAALKLSNKHDKNGHDEFQNYGNIEVKICTTTDVVDSDNDSAMSSTQSSYRSSASSPLNNLDSIESDSSHLSPKTSHYVSYSLVKVDTPSKSIAAQKTVTEYEKRNVCRSTSSDTNVSVSSSVGSAATSGSQASCSSLESSVADSDKRKTPKVHCVDTINRRNILASAKCRSGRDVNLSSPVIEPKFAHESCDRSPSPKLKSSDCLSTLTSAVSATSNKGENRRTRNKVIEDTDSDSDGEPNIRQRKSEFKAPRMKKNTILQNRHESIRKQNEPYIKEVTKVVDEAPKAISERIIKEINNTGVLHKDQVTLETKKDNLTKDNIMKLSEQADFIKEKNSTNGHVKETDFHDISIKTKNTIEKTKPTQNSDTQESKQSNKAQNQDCINGSYKVSLQRGAGAGVGLILAGGIDCEAKEVTVHRVLADSVAERAGLKRGARVRSINGCSTAGLTHAQTVAVLKERRPEVVIEIENESPEIVSNVECGSENAESKVGAASCAGAEAGLVRVVLEKAGGGAGLGFGLDGGRDSPRGDRPLTIKKLFAGGAAARSGCVTVGAELLSAAQHDMRGLTRTQAWAALKALPPGPVPLLLRSAPAP